MRTLFLFATAIPLSYGHGCSGCADNSYSFPTPIIYPQVSAAEIRTDIDGALWLDMTVNNGTDPLADVLGDRVDVDYLRDSSSYARSLHSWVELTTDNYDPITGIISVDAGLLGEHCSDDPQVIELDVSMSSSGYPGVFKVEVDGQYEQAPATHTFDFDLATALEDAGGELSMCAITTFLDWDLDRYYLPADEDQTVAVTLRSLDTPAEVSVELTDLDDPLRTASATSPVGDEVSTSMFMAQGTELEIAIRTANPDEVPYLITVSSQ
jgi:hypothetical protein